MSMIIDRVDLRDRMRSRTSSDLLEIIRNDGGAYTPAAMEVAREELTARSSAGPLDNANGIITETQPSLRSVLPVGLWLVFCFATAASVFIVLIAIVMTALFLAVGDTLREMLAPLLSCLLVATSAIWTAFAIRAERTYVRVLLLCLIGAAAVYVLAWVFVNRQITQEAINIVALLAVAFWYFGFSEDIGQYYKSLSAIRSS
jgi:hypothetical protein